MALELSASRLLGVDYGPLPYFGLDIYHTLITLPSSPVLTLSTGCPWAPPPGGSAPPVPGAAANLLVSRPVSRPGPPPRGLSLVLDRWRPLTASPPPALGGP